MTVLFFHYTGISPIMQMFFFFKKNNSLSRNQSPACTYSSEFKLPSPGDIQIFLMASFSSSVFVIFHLYCQYSNNFHEESY